MRNLKKKKNEQTHRYREQISGYQRSWGWGGMGKSGEGGSTAWRWNITRLLGYAHCSLYGCWIILSTWNLYCSILAHTDFPHYFLTVAYSFTEWIYHNQHLCYWWSLAACQFFLISLSSSTLLFKFLPYFHFSHKDDLAYFTEENEAMKHTPSTSYLPYLHTDL